MQVPPPGHFPAGRVAGKIPVHYCSIVHTPWVPRLGLGTNGSGTSPRRAGSMIGGHLHLYSTQPQPLDSFTRLHVPALIGLEECDGDSVPSHMSQVPAAISPLLLVLRVSYSIPTDCAWNAPSTPIPAFAVFFLHAVH